MTRIITEQSLKAFQEHLYEEEKQSATIQKYIRDLRKLMDFAKGRELTKKTMIRYKESLKENRQYKTSSINSYLVAANRYLEYMGWYDLRVKTYKVQKEAFLPEEKDLSREEYRRLVAAARRTGRNRLALLLQTICATGMRVSELEMLTVKAVRRGTADIYCKGKERQILLPRALQVELLHYIRTRKLKGGVVFQTASGKAMDRSNIWKEMKALCREAGVAPEKVFPHNLRHLFAKTFYEKSKDIGKLADILGHASIETTRIYIKTSSCEYRRQLDGLKLVFS